MLKLHIIFLKPSKDELRCLSISASKIIKDDLKFERLEINEDLANEMFKFNKQEINYSFISITFNQLNINIKREQLLDLS